MANGLFNKGKELMLTGGIDLPANTIKAALVSNAYTVSLTTHNFVADMGAVRLNTDQTLSGKTITGGVFDAADPTWSAVANGNTALAAVIYKDTGDTATSPLIAYIDTIVGFPLATNGGDVTVQWDNGSYKIFAL